MDEFRVLVKRAGLDLTEKELESLKPMFDSFSKQVAALHQLDLDDEDVAVRFSTTIDH